MSSNREHGFKWKLDRPLAILDIEATGINVRTDRLIDLAIIKILPDGRRTVHTFRVNPEMPIPTEASRIHGITDADVANSPPFRKVAAQVLLILDACDLGGYNSIRFDIPMLVEEFNRAGMNFDIEGRRMIDAQRIFHKKEPRDLSAALAYYCGEMHINAHGAESDALATVRVFEGQFNKYSDLPTNINELDKFCNPREPDWVDRTGKLKWANGQIVLNFGKKKGESLQRLIKDDRWFIDWILKGDFPRDMKNIVQQAADGIWPAPPALP